MNRILHDDLEKSMNATFDFKRLNNSTIFITGATGLIGSYIVKCLLTANRKLDLNIRVVANVRNISKAKNVFVDYLDKTLEFYIGDINDIIDYNDKVDYIIHGASATSSKYFVDCPVETIDIAINGTMNILKFAKEKNIKGFVYLSSLEVYGKIDKDESIRESDYGYIDFLSARSSYSEGKRMVECLCSAYFHEYSIPVKIARLTQTFGAGVDYNDSRVFAEFIRCVLEKKNIILHTTGETVRNYCYLSDAVDAILTILMDGENGEAYNIANKNTTCSIAEMAKLVASLCDDYSVDVIFDIDDDISKRGYNPTMKAYLNTEKLEKLGWKASVDLKEMFERTMESMKETHETNK